jgi:2-polyprenyl-3-methyl-5-hydroxy-6-metoxy-1,4-benzoquinol methylase
MPTINQSLRDALKTALDRRYALREESLSTEAVLGELSSTENKVSKIEERLAQLESRLRDVETARAPIQESVPSNLHAFRPQALAIVDAMIATIEDSDDEATLSELQALGPIYADILPIQKAIQDLKTHGPRYVAMNEVFTGLGLDEKSRVMEVGCNTGFLSFILKEQNPDLEVLAIDKSEKQILMDELLKRLLGIDVSFIAAEGNLIEYTPPASMDVVFLCELLEHFEYRSETQIAILKDSLAVCSPEGRLVITVPYEDRIPAPGHLTEFTRPMLESLIGEHCSEVEWLESARTAYGLEKHFVLAARP